MWCSLASKNLVTVTGLTEDNKILPGRRESTLVPVKLGNLLLINTYWLDLPVAL